MTQPLPTRVHIDPPIDQWRVAPRNGRTTPVIATGHQPYLWHPGILAKDLAAWAVADHLGGMPLHVVVDHNPIGALGIDLPTKQGKALSVRRLLLDPGPEAAALPPNRLRALDPARVDALISEAENACRDSPGVAQGLRRLGDAYANAGDFPSLAEQTAAVLGHLEDPFVGDDMPVLTTSRLVTPGFVNRLLKDPLGCVRAYNRAALAYPEAGIRPLYLGRDVVEVPLWAQDKTTVTPVYADLGDSKRPQLFTTAHNRHLDLIGPERLSYLRPRAITLSAIMRSELCDLFIHGTGGGVYDRVTERWWGDWVGEALAPMAVVSADVYLGFDVPTATRDELRDAVWMDHHLPFNVDRYTEADDTAEAALVREKHELLDHMNDDRDKRRRAKAFQRIHTINAELAERHADRIRDAHQRAADAKLGIRNAQAASRRDWCFALYPEDSLRDLRQCIADFL